MYVKDVECRDSIPHTLYAFTVMILFFLLAFCIACHKEEKIKIWDDSYPVWSPNGRYIAFDRILSGLMWPSPDTFSGLRLLDLVTMNVEDSIISFFVAAWSPNGEEILCIQEGMVIVNVETMDFKKVTPEGDTGFNYGWPDWSPEGSRILYVRSLQDSSWIYMTDTMGTFAKKLFSSAWAPSWHPAGDRLAFVGQFNNQWRVCIGDTNGNIIRFIDIEIGDWSGFNGCAQFSPDGIQIAYSIYELKDGGLDDFDIHICDSLGENDRKLTAGAQPYWSPDGLRIVFARYSEEDSSFSLWMINTDGGNLRKITD
jgi:Tol biopolymer transport system component